MPVHRSQIAPSYCLIIPSLRHSPNHRSRTSQHKAVRTLSFISLTHHHVTPSLSSRLSLRIRSLLATIYDFWTKKRARWGKPLIRRFQPPTQASAIVIVVHHLMHSFEPTTPPSSHTSCLRVQLFNFLYSGHGSVATRHISSAREGNEALQAHAQERP